MPSGRPPRAAALISDHAAQAPNRSMPVPSETFLRMPQASAPHVPVADRVPVDPTPSPLVPAPPALAGPGRGPVSGRAAEAGHTVTAADRFGDGTRRNGMIPPVRRPSGTARQVCARPRPRGDRRPGADPRERPVTSADLR
ncbi:hypothetical protein Srubr_05540 [Streptomyces rubradiris]|uniref:Uncharacterized protein n=1 Tax=Streptomyces rubradiris TaxID=285531 RepID=A0ABQ3R4C9_STRRR|nr:hypothetical protein Srubr_05540 [Streptomyces rubradiris]